MQGLLKYRIGLLIIGIFTLILTGAVVVQATAVKQDAESFTKASKTASQLNKYMSSADTIPSSLAAAKITNVPDSVTYKKLSSQGYEFCVTYKADSGGFSATDVETQLLSASQGGSLGARESTSSYEPETLYLETTHHKGENCQKVKPYLYTSYKSSYTSSNTTSGAEDCTSKYDYNKTYSQNTAYNECVKTLYGTGGR